MIEIYCLSGYASYEMRDDVLRGDSISRCLIIRDHPVAQDRPGDRPHFLDTSSGLPPQEREGPDRPRQILRGSRTGAPLDISLHKIIREQ